MTLSWFWRQGLPFGSAMQFSLRVGIPAFSAAFFCCACLGRDLKFLTQVSGCSGWAVLDDDACFPACDVPVKRRVGLHFVGVVGWFSLPRHHSTCSVLHLLPLRKKRSILHCRSPLCSSPSPFGNTFSDVYRAIDLYASDRKWYIAGGGLFIHAQRIEQASVTLAPPTILCAF